MTLKKTVWNNEAIPVEACISRGQKKAREGFLGERVSKLIRT